MCCVLEERERGREGGEMEMKEEVEEHEIGLQKKWKNSLFQCCEGLVYFILLFFWFFFLLFFLFWFSVVSLVLGGGFEFRFGFLF